MFETSLLASHRHRLQALASKGRRGAASACRLLDHHLDAVIATILLWNNFANVVIASSATVLAIRLFTDSEVVLTSTSLLTTATILILAEITPKTIGVRFPEQIACFAAPILAVLIRVIPIGDVISAFQRLFAPGGGDGVQQRQELQVEDLLAIIKDDKTFAEARGGHKAMLYRMIGLAEMSIRDLVINRKDIDYLDLEDDEEELDRALAESRHHMLPLCRDGLENVVGMVRVREALSARGQGRLSHERLEQLASKPIFLTETIDPIQALRQLVDAKRQSCLVVDEYGGLIGMLTAAQFFNRIFGGGENAGPDFFSLEDGQSVTVNGDELVRQVNLKYSLNLPETDGQTVAGLLVDRLQAFPNRTGKQIPFDDLVLTVTELDEIEIKQVSIRRG